MEFLINISYLVFASWVYLIFIHGRHGLINGNLFWSNNFIFEEKVPANQSIDKYSDSVCVIIPARNEEKTIKKTLDSIKNQNYKNINVIVVNDHSSDKTSEIVKMFKKSFKKVELITGKDLPSGWVGKTWALKQGVDAANKKKFDYYLFLDSDISLSQDLLNNVIRFIKTQKYVMISLMAKLNCDSFWEKLLIPPFIFFFQKLYPFNLVNKKTSSFAAAAGGFIFCKASVFKNDNLYNKIKNKLIDDCNIAKLLKQTGNIWLGLTKKVESGRSYNDLKSIWRMVSRTAFEQLKHSFLLLFICVLGLALIYLTPIFILVLSIFLKFDKEFFHLFFLNFSSFGMMLIIIMPTLNFYKVEKIFALALPFSATLYMCMTITSALNYKLLNGNIWKGRKY